MLKILVASTLAVLWTDASHAATRQIALTVRFDATKNFHDCSEAVASEGTSVGDCGAYLGFEADVGYGATLTLSGAFEQTPSGWILAGHLDTMECVMGDTDCLASRSARVLIEDDLLSIRLYDTFAARYAFDLSSGLGEHAWVDGSGASYGKGTFALSNATVAGLPEPVVTPLPAGAVLLLSGALGLAGMRRRRA